MIHEKNLKQKILWHCPYKKKILISVGWLYCFLFLYDIIIVLYY
jgi:hypothetical protein